MNANDVLLSLNRLGVGIRADGENIVVSPASRIPPEVKGAIKAHKSEILSTLRRVGEGQAPPIDRPPATEQELRRLYDHLGVRTRGVHQMARLGHGLHRPGGDARHCLVRAKFMSGHEMDGERPAQDPKRCPAVRKDGQACTAAAGLSGFCIGHRPGADEARRKGGAGTSRAARAGKLLPTRLRPVADALESAIEEVHRGELDPRRAQAMASLAGALVKVVTSGELEERLRVLEAGRNGS